MSDPSKINTYVGNNYGFGGNKFDGKFDVNLHDGINMPSASTPSPPILPPPPSHTDIDTYVGNNYGFGGNKFDGNYNINIGGGKKETPKVKPNTGNGGKTKPNTDNGGKTKPKVKPDQCNEKPQPCHTAGKSTYTLPGGGMHTSCPVCEGIWARNNSMSNYQALLRGDHIYG